MANKEPPSAKSSKMLETIWSFNVNYNPFKCTKTMKNIYTFK